MSKQAVIGRMEEDFPGKTWATAIFFSAGLAMFVPSVGILVWIYTWWWKLACSGLAAMLLALVEWAALYSRAKLKEEEDLAVLTLAREKLPENILALEKEIESLFNDRFPGSNVEVAIHKIKLK